MRNGRTERYFGMHMVIARIVSDPKEAVARRKSGNFSPFLLPFPLSQLSFCTQTWS
jgi:hypothetical protein